MKTLTLLLLSSLILHSSHSLPFFELGRNGRFGVKFLGYNAGINLRNGGVYAGTPFGQRVSAGLGGPQGLFAGANNGYGQQVGVGLGRGPLAGVLGGLAGRAFGGLTGGGQNGGDDFQWV